MHPGYPVWVTTIIVTLTVLGLVARDADPLAYSIVVLEIGAAVVVSRMDRPGEDH
jgi:hypothetical protein